MRRFVGASCFLSQWDSFQNKMVSYFPRGDKGERETGISTKAPSADGDDLTTPRYARLTDCNRNLFIYFD